MRAICFVTYYVMLITAVFAISGPAADATADPAESDASSTPRRANVVLSAKSGQKTFQLPDRFIVFHTDSVMVNRRLLRRDDDYTIDYSRGVVNLFQGVRAELGLHASYQTYPVSLETSYSHRKMLITSVLSDSMPVPRKFPAVLPPRSSSVFPGLNSSLNVTGSKTFRVLTGTNRDASLGQSLRLQITGKAAKDVDVVAILSDRSSPIQPQGNTKRLQELDNVLVEVRTPNVTTTMGDYHMTLKGSELGSYDRKLKGAQSKVTLPNGSFQVAAAVSEGTFTTNTFPGVEGNQGPYPLRGDGGVESVVVLSGTESVWLDGTPMNRGEDQDYTIDYTGASITFTRNRLITSDSRIVVDFEGSDRQYRRNLYLGRGEFNMGGLISVGTTFIRESDESISATGLPLGQIPVNSKANSRAATSQTPLYRLAFDEFRGITYYTYAGPDSGTVAVSFSAVGEGTGDYIQVDGQVYKYAGPNQGNFSPVDPASLPTSQSLLAFDLNSNPAAGVSVTGEFAVSGFNGPSSLGATTGKARTGNAVLLKTELAPRAMSLGAIPLGSASAAATFRNVQSTFTPAGRLADAEYYRRYSQGVDAPWRGRVMELSGNHQIGGTVSFTGGLGRMTRTDGFHSNRRNIAIQAAPTRRVLLRYALDHVEASGSLVNPAVPGRPVIPPRSSATRFAAQNAQGSYSTDHVGVLISYKQEGQSSTENGGLGAGRDFRELTAGLDRIRIGPLSAVSTASYRITDTVRLSNEGLAPKLTGAGADHVDTPDIPSPSPTGSWQRESTAWTLRQRLALSEWRSLSLSAHLIQRQKTFREVEGVDNRESLIDGRLRYRPWRQALDMYARYEINNTSSAKADRQYILVGRGRGDLSLEESTGEYVPDPDGEFIERYRAVGSYEPVTGVKASFRLRNQMYRKKTDASGIVGFLLRNVSTDTYFAVDEKSRSGDHRPVYSLNYSGFQQDSTTVLGSMNMRQDVFLFPTSRRIDLRLRFRHSSNMNNQLISGAESRANTERSIRVRASLNPATASEMILAQETRIRMDSGRRRYTIQSRRASVSASHRPMQPLELYLRITGSRDSDGINGITSSLVSAVPRVTYSIRGQGRLRFEADWANVTAPDDSYLPYEMVNGRQKGHSGRWVGSVDYRVGNNVSMLMQYEGRADSVRPTVHTARVEVRAFF